MMKRLCCLFLLLLTSCSQDSAKSVITVSKETTHFTGPVREDGYVEFLSSLNQEYKVKPEENAVVLLLEAIGPMKTDFPPIKPIDLSFYKWLGVEPPVASDANLKLLDKKYIKDPAAMDQEVVEKWLRSNQAALDTFVKASQRKQYFLPVVGKSIHEWEMVSHEPYSEGIAGLLLRARFSLKVNRHEEALNDILAVLRLSRLATNCYTMIGYLEAASFHTKAVQSAMLLLQEVSTPKQTLLRLQKELETLPTMHSYAKVYRGSERAMAINSVFILHRHGLDALKTIDKTKTPIAGKFLPGADWDKQLKRLNQRFEEKAKTMEEPDAYKRHLLRQDQADENARQRQAVTDKSFMEDSALSEDAKLEKILQLLFGTVSPPMTPFEDSAIVMEEMAQLLPISVALELYQRDQGNYPQDLASLKPAYFKELPTDRFTGLSLRYKTLEKGYVLYSVGPDGMDDEGRTKRDTPRGDDVTLRIQRK